MFMLYINGEFVATLCPYHAAVRMGKIGDIHPEDRVALFDPDSHELLFAGSIPEAVDFAGVRIGRSAARGTSPVGCPAEMV